MATFDQYEAEYVELIHSDRQQAMARLAEPLADEEFDWSGRRGAAAAAWVIAAANRTIGSYRSPMTDKQLLGHFGMTGSVSDRAQSLILAAGIDLRLTYGTLRVGDPVLRVSRRRRELAEERGRTLAPD